jgi:DNA-binding NtrC family response regulator
MGQSLRVLVVEDEALLRWSICETLRGLGHLVTEAASAGAARDAVEDAVEPIDVVLVDFRLPDSDDLGLLRDLRRRLPQSGLLLMTAYGRQDVVQEALQLGVYRVLNKPFDLNDLEALLQNARAARLHPPAA